MALNERKDLEDHGCGACIERPAENDLSTLTLFDVLLSWPYCKGLCKRVSILSKLVVSSV